MTRSSGASLALFVACTVSIAGLAELALAIVDSRKAPTEAEWGGVKAKVAELRGRADAVEIAPWWAEPHARRAFGEAILPLRDVARPDSTRYARVVEVSALGQHLPELDGWKTLEEVSLGRNLTARIVENPAPAKVVTDFVDLLDGEHADAAYRFADHVQTCVFRTSEVVAAPGLFGHPAMPAKRFACGNLPWQSVGVTVQDDQDFRARRCIWAHPPTGGATVVTFHRVALARSIHGHMSIHWTLEREKRGAPIDLDVVVDGDTIGTAHHEDGEGWKPFDLPLRDHAGALSAEVAFVVRTANANERNLCFEADSR